jgi:hypothetical protein
MAGTEMKFGMITSGDASGSYLTITAALKASRNTESSGALGIGE